MATLTAKMFTQGDAPTVQKLDNCANGFPSEVQSHFSKTANNRGEHISRLQLALKTIQSKDIDLKLPPFEVTGVYDAAFAAAVSAYKTARDLKNYAGRIDDVIGIKTMAEMDKDLTARREDPPPAPPPKPLVADADIVVCFKGGMAAGFLDGDHALNGPNTPSVYERMYPLEPGKKNAHRFFNTVFIDKTTGRLLFKLARLTKSVGSHSFGVFVNVFADLLELLALHSARISRVFIHGSSSGGRNAIDFAAFLSRKGIKPHLVASVDAAFFQDMTSSRPEAGSKHRPRTVPIFHVDVGGTPLQRCHNWFQTWGNHATESFRHGLLFTSSMDHEEIHGKIDGFFTNRNLDDDIFARVPKQPNGLPVSTFNDDGAHVACADIAIPEVWRLIGVELRSPAPSKR